MIVTSPYLLLNIIIIIIYNKGLVQMKKGLKVMKTNGWVTSQGPVEKGAAQLLWETVLQHLEHLHQR